MRYCVLVGWLVGSVGGVLVPLYRRDQIINVLTGPQQFGELACKLQMSVLKQLAYFAVVFSFGNFLLFGFQLVNFVLGVSMDFGTVSFAVMRYSGQSLEVQLLFDMLSDLQFVGLGISDRFGMQFLAHFTQCIFREALA